MKKRLFARSSRFVFSESRRLVYLRGNYFFSPVGLINYQAKQTQEIAVTCVNVLLSTYNGQAYLTEQLQSIRAQSCPNILLHVRDDGSEDDTVSILKKWYADGDICRLDFGENIGVIESYFLLLKQADNRAAFYAFADQDDIWRGDKIERATRALAAVAEHMPAMYCSRLRYVDHKGCFLSYSPLPNRGLSFRNALVENVAAGCTIVMNSAARELVLSRLPDMCGMHDWWCYLVVSAFGRIFYDECPGIDYRLHHQNDVGVPLSFLEISARRAKRFFNVGGNHVKSYAQAVAFFRCFGHRLSGENKKEIDALMGLKTSLSHRYRYAWTKGVYRQSRFDDWVLRLLIFLNRF